MKPEQQMQTKFPRSAVFIHWILATSIFFLFVSSWWMMGLPLPSMEIKFRAFPFQLHKNIGITLVFLIFILLYVRWRHAPLPDKSDSMKPWMRSLAILDHVLLYGLILAVCVSGYLSSAHTRWDTTVWWLIDLPRIAEADDDLNEFYSEIHLWTAWALLGVIAVHVSGAVYHAFRNDGIVRRMLRW